MKTIDKKFQKLASLTVLFACMGVGLAGANPESAIYAPAEIHHYASNGGSPTVTVLVPSHYSFKTGHYVMIPSYSAEAPLPHDKYQAASWVPCSSAILGHWAADD